MATAPKVLICGSREWSDPVPIQAVLACMEGKGITLIHGGARGADRLAGDLAKKYSRITVEEFPADWRGKGKAAGAIRNKLMLEQKPTLVYAFKDGFDFTYQRGGTENMVRIAKEAGVPTYVVSHG